MADLLNKKALFQSPRGIDDYLMDLHRTTLNLRVLGLQILSLSVLNLCGFIAMAGIFADRAVLFVCITVLTGTIILCAAFHDAMRRHGEVLFEEVSDELQWQRTEAKNRPRRLGEMQQGDRPTLDARVTLRSFSYVADLPLVPGKFGPGIYVALNLLFLFFVWFLYFQPIKHIQGY